MKLRPASAIPAVALALCFICFVISCDEVVQLPESAAMDYLPMEVGSYIIYDLDSTQYDDFNEVVLMRSLEVRESVESVFIGAGGDENYRILREYRDNASEDWGAAGYDVWFGKFTGNAVERVEENQRYVKLVFPLRLGKTWNGNVYISVDPEGPLGYLEGWEYTVTALDVPETINGQSFDSTVTIVEQADGTAIDTVGSRATYAKGIGLISKDLWVLETQCIVDCQGFTWEEKAQKGFFIKQRIKSYGQF